MKELKMELLVEDVKGNREVAYTLLEAAHPLFLTTDISVQDEVLLLESYLEEGMYGWERLSELTVEERLRHLLNIGRLYKELEFSKYTYSFEPESIAFTMNASPQFIHKGIKGQIPPYDSITEDEFLQRYKAMILSLLDDKTDYLSLMDGKLPFYKGNLFCETVLQSESISDILHLLQEKYVEEKQLNEQNYSRMSNTFVTRLKISAIISSIVAVCSLIGIGYLFFFALPRQEMISSIRLAFIQEDYSQVISTLKNTDSKSLSQEDKYIVAYSVIMTEHLTDEQKTELSKISSQSNEDYLRYWVLIGQAKIDEAIDIASFLDDPQLLMYGMTKKIDEIQRNPDMTSEERTEKMNGYKSKLEELKKQYLTPSDNSATEEATKVEASSSAATSSSSSSSSSSSKK
ncbi:type VII secretion protein EssB [Streptococcus cuniculi]|uniref:Type VII secretion protein EssB n=1 Tax=Streptococcus cuniculi TaxID=1432788 RepID=A0A1Q8E9U9_9STRE|nr:type VII secretion protein EssB [Streptococcus cuniculi]OLF48568.1 type VII secretion protein EssB [Streptococcus cuniculi]